MSAFWALLGGGLFCFLVTAGIGLMFRLQDGDGPLISIERKMQAAPKPGKKGKAAA